MGTYLGWFLAAIPAAYRLGSLAYNKNAGMFVALLVAISPFLNWYGNEARMYSQLVFFTILNQYFFLKLWRKPSRGAWWGYGLAAAAGLSLRREYWLSSCKTRLGGLPLSCHSSRGPRLTAKDGSRGRFSWAGE